MECLGNRRARSGQAVVAEDHCRVGTEIAYQTLTLAKIQRNALIVVVAELAVELERMLTDRQQAMLLRRYSRASCRMSVNDKTKVFACHMNGRMNRETGRIHAKAFGLGGGAFIDDLAQVIDLDQIRSAHLVEQNTVAINQERWRGAWQTRRDVRVDHVRHAEM